MTTAFVIGYTGFIGRHLAAAVGDVRRGLNLVTVGRRTGSDIFLDLADLDLSGIRAAASPGDIAYVLSAMSAPAMCSDQPQIARLINVDNTVRLIEALLSKSVRVVFASSDVVFGASPGAHSDDDDLAPFGAYGHMKAQIETCFRDEPSFKVARFSYVLGGGDSYSSMLAEKEKAGQAVEVFAGFERNVIGLRDVIAGLTAFERQWDRTKVTALNFSGPRLVGRDEVTAVLVDKRFPGLEFRVVEAPERFWDSRPRVIETRCDGLTRLLGRAPMALEELVANWSW